MKLTLAAILLTAIGLALAIARSGRAGAGDLAILGVAVGSVCVFGALPVVLGNRRKNAKTPPVRVNVPGKPGAADR